MVFQSGCVFAFVDAGRQIHIQHVGDPLQPFDIGRQQFVTASPADAALAQASHFLRGHANLVALQAFGPTPPFVVTVAVFDRQP